MIDSSEKTYEGTRPCNGWHSFLNLKTPDNIAMMQLAGTGGNLYFRGKQAAGVTMAGTNWVKIRDSANWGVSLFDNSSGTTGAVPLSESAANFSYLEIAYTKNGQIYSTGKIPSPNQKEIHLGIGQWFSFASSVQMGYEACTVSGTSITRGTYYFMNTSTGGGVLAGNSTNDIAIFKVIGYR